MAYFEKDFIKFFKELEKNNDRDWFKANKPRYEEVVKKPFELFVADLIVNFAKQDKKLIVTPKECIFRIYRDVRFSKNKQPYKLNVSAIICPKGRKGKDYPGMYVELNHNHFRFYTGCYFPEKQALTDIRYEIAAKPAEFRKLISGKKFVDLFGEIRGEKNKILPKDLKEPASTEPLIFNKSFYSFHEEDPNVLLEDDLMKKCLDYYKIARPLNDWLIRAGGYSE
ncbi:DUF2461 domain-containing protein [Salibacteraceae bacterium]|nr:DUF2461 domain-containing protein [Salibacteraceae bacterium]